MVLVRDRGNVAVYLDGHPQPEIAGEAEIAPRQGAELLFVGGRNDNFANFAGILDEAAVYDRVLTPEEVARHYAESGIDNPGWLRRGPQCKILPISLTARAHP